MKKYYVFIALALVAGMTVSCKNNAKKAAEATEEVADVVEIALSDEVMASIDGLAQKVTDENGIINVASIISENLTEEEKLVKPDYLLEAEDVQNLVNRSQRIGALAILVIERPIRQAYEMPIEATDEAIVSLIVGLNHPISFEDRDLTPAEKVKKTYEACKERGDVQYFWEFTMAVENELVYLIANNADKVYGAISEEQRSAAHSRYMAVVEAIKELAEYDEGIAAALQNWEASIPVEKEEDLDAAFSSVESAKQTIVNGKDNLIARRNNMLK